MSSRRMDDPAATAVRGNEVGGGVPARRVWIQPAIRTEHISITQNGGSRFDDEESQPEPRGG